MPSAMAAAPHNTSHEEDALDRYFNYDDAVEDFLKDLPIEKDKEKNKSTNEPTKDIDEEVKVKKQRRPNPKLDDDRLLSQHGLPKLRKITKSRLKFRGKGHEFSDISRLLNTYQLWLDDLYPRAKFRDALGMVEKVGHSKRMQVMRRAWLDATKPYQRNVSPVRGKDANPVETDGAVMSGALPEGGSREDGNRESEDALVGPSEAADNNDAPEADDLDSLLAENAVASRNQSTRAGETIRGPFVEDDDMEEDELDALLAEDASLKQHPIRTTSTDVEEDRPTQDNFADEEEIMAGMDTW